MSVSHTPGPNTFVLSNDKFVELLKGATVTAYKGKDDPYLSAAYLRTVRTPDPEGGPGTVQALVALSGDGISAGQTVVVGEGELASPVLVDLPSVGWAISMATTSKKKMKEVAGSKADFAIALSVQGTTLNVQALTDGFPGEQDGSGQLPLMDASMYPVRDVMSDLVSRVEKTVKNSAGDAIPAGCVKGESSTQLKVKSDAEKAFKTPIFEYTLGHPAGPRVLTTGDGRWRASVPGVETPEDLNPDMPDMDIIDLASVAEDGDSDTATE